MPFRDSQSDSEAFLQSLENRQEALAFPAQVVIEGQMALADGTPVVIKKNDQPAEPSPGAEPPAKATASAKPGDE